MLEDEKGKGEGKSVEVAVGGQGQVRRLLWPLRHCRRRQCC